MCLYLYTQDCDFACHRLVLAASSDYFRACFSTWTRPGEEEVHHVIPDVSGDVMELIIQFIYTSHVDITVSNVQALCETASRFQVSTNT